MGRSSDQVLFSIVRARALVPDDRLKDALTTAQREEIPLERVLLREGLLKAAACEHVIQSRALRARSCQRCGEFTYLLEEQGVVSTPCERCGGSLQPSPADGPKMSSSAATTASGLRDPTPTRKAPPAAAALREQGKKEKGPGASAAAGPATPATAAAGATPAARPRPTSDPPRPEIRAALAKEKDGVKAIAGLARPTRRPEGQEPGKSEGKERPAGGSGGSATRSRPAPPPMRTPPPRPGAAPSAPPAVEERPRTPEAEAARGELSRRLAASAESEPLERLIQPILEDAGQRLHARLALELRAHVAAELDALAQKATESAVGQAEKRLQGESRRLLEQLQRDAEAAVSRAAATSSGPSEGNLSAWSALVAERARAAVLAGDLPAAWEERARSAAESAARELAGKSESAGGAAGEPTPAALEQITARVLESIWAHLEATGLEGFPARVSEGVLERARGAAQEVAGQNGGGGAGAGPDLEQITARVLESIWAHLETTGLEGFPARVVEGVQERARSAVGESGTGSQVEPLDPEALTGRVLEAVWAHLEQAGAGGFPARIGEELTERALAAAREDRSGLDEKLEAVATAQRESHVLAAEELTGFGARLATLERRLGVAPPEGGSPGEDPVERLGERLDALERSVAALAESSETAARAASASGAASDTTLSQESLDQAVQASLDAVEERLRFRFEGLVMDLEERLGARAKPGAPAPVTPVGAVGAGPSSGPGEEEFEARISAAVERALDATELAQKVAMLATAPVMQAIDQRISQVDEEVVKRITRQVYSEMRKMAEERRTGKFLRDGKDGDDKDQAKSAEEPLPADSASN